MWKILEKRPFFRADMAGLGKYHTGGYGRIGVYRVKAGFFFRPENISRLSVIYGAVVNSQHGGDKGQI